MAFLKAFPRGMSAEGVLMNAAYWVLALVVVFLLVRKLVLAHEKSLSLTDWSDILGQHSEA